MINSPIGDNETPCPLCPQIWHFRRSEGVSTTNVGVKARLEVASTPLAAVACRRAPRRRTKSSGERTFGWITL